MDKKLGVCVYGFYFGTNITIIEIRRGEITNFGRNLNPGMITNQDLTGFGNLVGLLFLNRRCVAR